MLVALVGLYRFIQRKRCSGAVVLELYAVQLRESLDVDTCPELIAVFIVGFYHLGAAAHRRKSYGETGCWHCCERVPFFP